MFLADYFQNHLCLGNIFSNYAWVDDSFWATFTREATDCSSPDSSCLWNSPGKNTGWVAIPFSRSFWPRDQTQVSHIAGRFFTVWATMETTIRSGVEPKFGFWTGFLVVLIHCSGECGITGTGINIACVLMTFHSNWGSSQAGGWLEAENCWEIDPYWEVCSEEGSTLLSLVASTREARFACPGICLYLLTLCILEIHYLVSGAGRTSNFCCVW